MPYQYSPYLLPLFAAAIISFLVAAYVWPRRQTPGATYLALIAITITPWALGYALEIASTTLEMKLFWGKSQYVSIVFAPYLWLLFALAYTHQDRPQLKQFVTWLALLPLATLILVFTTERHGLHWRDFFIKETGNLSVLGVTYGPWFWVHFASSYLFLLSGTIILLRALWRMPGIYQAQIVAVLTAIISPWIANILYFTGFNPLPGLDLTPFAFTISVVALAWGIFGYRLGDVLPIARDLALEAMRDGVIILDRRGRVADLNTAASRIIGVPAAHAIGVTSLELFQPWPHIFDQLHNEQEGDTTITIGEGAGQRHYELTLSVLHNAQKTLIGQVITLHDTHATSSPPPQFADRSPLPTLPTLASVPVTQAGKHPLIQALINFVVTPTKIDLPTPPDINPSWVQTRERAFTLIMRAVAILGTTTILVAFPYLRTAPLVLLAYLTVVVLAWILGLARNIPFVYRNTVFLLFVYSLGMFETVNFGFSAESFAFFFAFVMLAVFMAEFRGGVIALVLSVITLGFWGWQIGTGNHIPGATTDVIPAGVGGAASSVSAFVATAGACLAAATIMTRSLNRAWQQEAQALNLLGQERDLLEQRIAERTKDLVTARDQAVKSSLDLQKYFLAIEQSGNSIFITDPNGNIEYVNPKFVELTGYSLNEVRGANPRMLKSGEHSTDFYHTLWQTISSGQIWQGEMRNRRKDGSLYWQSATIAPVLNQAGLATNYVAINEDITAQKQLQEQLQRQNEYLSILHQITIDLLNRRDIDKLLPAIVNGACFLLDAPLGEFMLKEGDYMVVRAYTKNQSYLTGERADRQTAQLSWQAHDTLQPVVLENYSAWAHHRDIYDVNPLYAVADFPVIVGDECIGVLALGRTREAYPFAPDEIETGVLFARLAALVLDNANLYDSALKEIEERRRAETSLQLINHEQQILTAILQLGMEHRPLDDLLLAALDEILSISWLNLLSQGGIFLKEGVQGHLKLKAYRNLPSQIRTLCQQVAEGQCLCGRAAATRQVQFAQHVDAHHEIQYQGMADHGHYNIPILSGETVLGVIVLYLPPGYQKVDTDISFLQTIANTLAGILERKRAEEQNQAFLEDMKSLQEIHLLLSELEEPEQLYIQMISLSQSRLGLDRVGLFLLDSFTNTLKGTFGIDPDGRVRDERYYKEVVAADHWTVEIVNAPFHARLWEDAPLYDDGQIVGTGWKIAAALWNGHKAIGYLVCDNYLSQKPIRPYEIELLSLLGSTFGHLVERKHAAQRLAIAHEQALQASRFKSQLLAKVSHELRTPLGIILGYTELLRDEAFGPLSQRQKRIAGEVIDSTEFLSSVVGELLDEAQFEANTAQLTKEPFTLRTWLEQAETKMGILAERKGLRFAVSIDPALPDLLYGDERRLQQILINLTGNAIKFTKQGEVRICLNRPDPDHWTIEVSDTGLGIPEEAQAYIFEPFRQVDGSITREHRGTGLGLSIVKQLAEMMNGWVELQSTLGEGSIFTVWLPLETEPVAV